jgi:hypothetical protein
MCLRDVMKMWHISTGAFDVLRKEFYNMNTFSAFVGMLEFLSTY